MSMWEFPWKREKERGKRGRRQSHVSLETKITAKPRSHVLACHQPRGGLSLDATQTTPFQ